MATKTIRIARHVYLKTQQRRLRHVKSLLVRNLTLPDLFHGDPLSISVYFTLHSTHNPEKVLYKSESLQETYSPSWESVQFSPQQFQKYAALPTFILRLWVRIGSLEEEYQLAHEKLVELFDLAYLGPFVNKDGSGYPPNSVVIGMFEGYYSHPGVGGVPCPPRTTHSLGDFLPPQSLLEVQKSEVLDSYYHPVLMRILNRQEVLNRVMVGAQEKKAEMEQYMQVEEAYFSKTRKKEELRTRLKVLRLQLEEQQRMEQEEREQLSQVRKEVDTIEDDLRARQEELSEQKAKFDVRSLEHSNKKDQLANAKRNQLLRQRNMVLEIAQVFFIKEVSEKHTICNVILPSTDQLEQLSSVDQLGVALGYVAHLVHQLSRVLLIPLQYQILPKGSRTFICDHISDEALIDSIKEFPLFLKGSEKSLFQYAVYLLNKDIAQIRQYCGYGTSRSTFKKTLPNLKLLLERLTKDAAQQLDGVSPRMSIPIDTASLCSYTPSLLDSSIASSTITPPTPPSRDESYHITPNGMSLNPGNALQSVPDVSPYQTFPSQNGSSMHGQVASHMGLNLQGDITAYQLPSLVDTGAEDSHLDAKSAQSIGGRIAHEANPDILFSSGLEQQHHSEQVFASEDLFSDPVTKGSLFANEDLFSDPVTKGSLFANEELFGDPVHTGNDKEFSQQTPPDADRQTPDADRQTPPDADRQPDSENKPLNLDDEGSADASRPRKDTNASDSSRKTDDTLFADASPQELQSTPMLHHTVPELKGYPAKHDNVSRFPLSALQGAEPPASVEGGLLDSTAFTELQEEGSDSQHDNSSTRRTQVTYAPFTVGEGGFIKTDVATPHIISSRLSQQSNKGITQIFCDTSYIHQHTASSSIEDDDAHFLEDFIDGPT